MKFSNYFVIIAGLLCLASGCKDDDDAAKNPVDQLPPATQEGAFTFACLVNGEPFVVTNTSQMVAIYQGGGLQVSGDIETQKIDKSVRIVIGTEIKEGETYKLFNDNNMRGEFYDLNVMCFFNTNEETTGTVKITYFDQTNFIVSGTFEYDAISSECQDTVSITDGRFDLKYIP